MTLSRTARILIAVLLLAAAAFFWVNFFSQEQPATSPVTATNTPSSSPEASPTPSATNGSTTGAASTGSAPADKNAAPVVAPNKPAVATRDLQVAELPFLVTQPPAAGQTSAGTAAGGNAGATPASATQTSASAQRMSVNPFSPIVVQAPPTAPAPTRPPAPQQVTTAAAPPNQPGSPPKLAEAPAPQPVAPPPPQASGLPHALPSGMLPTTPSVLQSTRAQATSSAPKDLGPVAAVRVPNQGDNTSLGNSQIGSLTSGPSVPNVLGPNQANATSSGQQANAGNGNAPLQAGTDSLSRYLRDNNVRFTGTVLGPVSLGVFRSS